jgi:hypothetical protein
VSAPQTPEDPVVRLLKAALSDDLPETLGDELRRAARRAWEEAASAPPRPRWTGWLRLRSPATMLWPQAALLAVALVLLGAGAAMQAAPASPDTVGSFRGRQASLLAGLALGRARTMQCDVEGVGARGIVSRRVEWSAPDPEPSVLATAALARADGPPEKERDAAGPFSSPASLAGRLAGSWWPAPRTDGDSGTTETFTIRSAGDSSRTVTIDEATHLPVRFTESDRDGSTLTAVCRWP